MTKAVNRMVYAERVRDLAAELRRSGRHDEARKIERLARQEEFSVLDEVFDRMADFEKAVGEVAAVAGASPTDIERLEKRILATGERQRRGFES